LPMDSIFSRNTILNARSLTDDMQCRALALQLLYWKFQQCRYKPETNKLEHLLIFDDASRFFGTAGDQFSASSRTSPLGHILALLRATGTGVVVATQLPAYMDPSLTALSRSMLVVGGIGGSKHLKVISDFMSLDEEQTKAITRLSIREAVGFAPGTAYKECVHGWVPFVKNPDQSDISYQQDDYFDDFDIEPWHHLTEIPTQQENLPQLQTETTTTKPKPQGPMFQPVHPALDGLTPQTKTLLWDCIYYPYSSVSARMKRLSIFGRVFDNSKRQACENGLLLESSAGATKYLIAAKTLYDIYNTPCPYKRGISIEHSFYCGLACFLLKKDPQYKSVCPEAPIGTTGQTSDIRTITHGGHLEAWEICLSTTHLFLNATKYQNTAFSKIMFLARNYELSTAIKGFIKASGLDPDLMAKIEYMHFSKLLNRQRKWSQY